MQFLQTLTNKQLVRLWNRILERIAKLGGTWDWPTLWAVYPELAECYRMVRNEGKRRKQLGLAE